MRPTDPLSLPSGEQPTEVEQSVAAQAAAAQADSALLRSLHRMLNFHDGTTPAHVTLSQGRTVARRDNDYFGIVFSDEPVPVEPVYYEVRSPHQRSQRQPLVPSPLPSMCPP
jgi:hypothetical protein